MRNLFNRNRRWTIALVAAFAILLQSLAIAYAFSDGSAEVRLDAFGNPICNAALNHADNGKGPSSHAKLPSFCLFGNLIFAAYISGPAGIAIYGAHMSMAVPFKFPPLPRIDIGKSAYLPGNPRAPSSLT